MGDAVPPRPGGSPGGDRETDASPERARRSALDAAERYRVLLELMPAGVMVFDRQTCIVDANAAAGEIMRVESERLVGHRLRDLLQPGAHEILERVLAGETAAFAGPLPAQPPDEPAGWLKTSWAPLRDEHGDVSGGLVVGLDLTAQEFSSARLEQQSFHDPVTELPAPHVFASTLAHGAEGARVRGTRLGLLRLDLDRFAALNDELGAAAGDTLLRAVGQRLARSIRRTDVAARASDDAFSVLLGDLPSTEQAAALAGRLRDRLAEPVAVGKRRVTLRASAGLALLPDHACDADHLERCAQVALQAAKERGGDTLVVCPGGAG